MNATRTLEKAGKTVVVEWDRTTVTVIAGAQKKPRTLATLREAAKTFAEAVEAKLDAGYTAKSTSLPKLAAALAAETSWNHAVKAFSADEVPAALALAIKDPHVHVDLLRKVVTPDLLAFFVREAEDYQGYQQAELVNALAFAAKQPASKTQIQTGLAKLVPKVKDAHLKKLLERLVRKLGAPPKLAPVAPARAKTGTKEADLFAAIAAEPDSDEPRLVYADWLLENGIGWGEYIQVACGATKLDRTARDARLAALERKHAKQFLAPIRPFIRSWRFERGLLSWIQADAQLFMDAADAIADRAPRAELALVGLKAKRALELGRAPLGRFAFVSLDSNRIGDEAAIAIATSPQLVGLDGLHLGYNLFGDAGARAFATSPHVHTLRILQLANTSRAATAETLALFLSSKQLPKLRTLGLAVAGTGLGGIIANAKLRLEELALIANELGDDDVATLVAAWGTKPRFVVANTMISKRLTKRGIAALDKLNAHLQR